MREGEGLTTVLSNTYVMLFTLDTAKGYLAAQVMSAPGTFHLVLPYYIIC